MADEQTSELQDAVDAPATAPETVISIPIPKAGKGIALEVDYSMVPQEVYIEALTLGFKELLNRKMTKLKSTKDMTGKQLEEQRAAIMAQAEKNKEDCLQGRVRGTAGKSKEKAAGPEVVALAKKIALKQIKDKIKANGDKIGNYKPSVLTQAAKNLVEQNPKIMERAKEIILEQNAAAASIGDISLSGVEADPELLAASQAKAKEAAEKAAKKAPKAKQKKGTEQRAQA